MTAVRVYTSIAALAALLALVAAPASAQSNDEVFPQFQWNFSTPGARANAMGRAFTGLADDASAAVTNPAGLTSLTRPQVYFEYDSNDLRVARLSAENSFVTLAPTTTSQTVNAPAFFSLSAPIGKKLAVAFTRHEFLNYRENFTLAPRPVPGASTPGFTEFPVNGSSNFAATSYDGSVAYAVTSQLRVGVTFGADHLDATSSAQRFALACSPQGCGDTFGVTERFVNGQPLLVNQTSINSSSSGASFTVGTLFVPNEKLSVGLQFSRGPKLGVAEHLQFNPGFANLTTDTNQTPVEFPGSPFAVPINVPNRLGFGAAYRANSRLLATVDFVWIGYSSLASQFVVVIDSATLSGSQYSIPNVVESHVGAEYLLVTGKHPVFIRGGFFTSPDHSVRFTALTVPVNADSSAAQTAINDLLPRNTTFAGTVGAGFVFGQHAQLDLAYVGTREFVASLGARF